MNYNMVDLSIVFIYLAFTLYIGIKKGINIKSLKDYAIGDYKFSDSTLIATLTATWVGAATLIGLSADVYQYGIVWAVIFICSIGETLIFTFLAQHIVRFKGCLSAADILGKWYGDKARIIGGICTVIYSIGIIGTQIAAIGYIFDTFFNINPAIGIFISAIIVIIYSSFGGIKSVVYTDILQFGFFIIALPLIASIMLSNIGGLNDLIKNLPVEHLKIFPAYGTKAHYITLFLFFALPACDACLMQRVLMSKDSAQISKSFKYTALITVMFYIVIAIISLCALISNPDLNPNNVIYTVIKDYMPSGVRGLGIVGCLAVLMSTADSYLNVSAVAIINDVINPIRKERKLSDKAQMMIVKITTITMGILAIFFATSSESIMQLVINTWIIWSPIVVVPLLAAVLGIESNAKIFMISAFSGLLTVVIWILFGIEGKTGINGVVPAKFVNLIVFSCLTYYYRKFNPQSLTSGMTGQYGIAA